VPDEQPIDNSRAAARERINPDPDIDLRQAKTARQAKSARRRLDEVTMLATIAAGGAAGAAARYAIGQGWPTAPGAFPASTLAINVLGCALIGVLMVLITEVWSRQRLIRPFLGTGVLGGFTTFSTYTVDIQRLVAGAHVDTALLYLALTPIGAILSVWAAAHATRRLVNWRIQ
jgi:CrcB protein